MRIRVTLAICHSVHHERELIHLTHFQTAETTKFAYSVTPYSSDELLQAPEVFPCSQGKNTPIPVDRHGRSLSPPDCMDALQAPAEADLVVSGLGRLKMPAEVSSCEGT